MKQPVFHMAPIALAVASLVTACGGSGVADAPPVAMVSISGVVANGPLQGAVVCYDVNDNGACDADEPKAASATDVDGRYSLSVPTAMAGKYAVVAEVPATALNKDTGLAVGAALTLRSPATAQSGAQKVFVSALTSAVAELAQANGLPVAEAEAMVKASLGLSMSPLADYTAPGGDPGAALAAKAVTALAVDAAQLAAAAKMDASKARALVQNAMASQLDLLATALAASTGATAADKAREAATAARMAMNLGADTAVALANVLTAPSTTPDPAGPFVSLRRFAYADANNYSYTVFVGDSSQKDGAGEFVAHEMRKSLAASADQPYNRNQAYWTGSDWQVCDREWQASTRIKQATAANGKTSQSSLYCGGSKALSSIGIEDISGKTMREVVARIRAYPKADGVGAHTDARGLPVKWGPDPALLPADAVFAAGAKLLTREQQADLGGTDRLELSTKSNVRWPDGKYRQATTLEQSGGMPGNLADATVVPGNANTVYVFDLPMATQADATLEAFKRWRAGFDITAMKLRFYACDQRKSDQAAINCAAQGDGTLAISQQGDARVMKVVSGFPAELRLGLGQERFWAERGGTVFRGVRDLPRTRSDQRLNAPAWDAMRAVLGIAASGVPQAPAGPGPFEVMRSFSFTDANNYSHRLFIGDTSQLDGTGYYLADDLVNTYQGGTRQPVARNRLYWTGSAWQSCGVGPGSKVIRVNSVAPFDSSYCAGYLDQRAQNTVLTIAGRRMSDVVNDIRAYGSKDGSFDYAGWGPNPSTQPQLATALFPAGATMEYRGNRRIATPVAIATAANDQARVAPAANSNAPFATWPFAISLDEFIAKYPGDFQGASLNGNLAFWVWGYDLATAPDPTFTTRVEIRVAFDAMGQKARFYQNNRAVNTGNTTNYQKLMDTTYTIETLGGVRILKFAAMPDGFETAHRFSRLFAERNGGVWYAFKDAMPGTVDWSVRLNREANQALREALGIQ